MAVSNPGASNLAAPVSWNSFATPSAVNAMTVCYGNMYAGTNSGVYVYQNGTWQPIPGAPQTSIALMNIASVLYVATTSSVFTLSAANAISPYGGAAPATITCAANDSSNHVYAGFQEAVPQAISSLRLRLMRTESYGLGLPDREGRMVKASIPMMVLVGKTITWLRCCS
jgi:hypothetical protein